MAGVPTGTPEISKVATDIAIAAAKPLIKKGIEKVISLGEKVERSVSEAFDVKGREMTILCPEAIQRYSLCLVSKKSSFFSRKVQFEFGRVRRAAIRSVMGLESINAITFLDNGFELNLNRLKPGELYILDVEHGIEDPKFIESLVNREVVDETPRGESTEYWMVAQMKHLDALKTQYGRIDLRDIDFNVNVGIHQDVNTKIPGIFRDKIETLARLSKRLGRDEKFMLYRKLLTMQQQKYGGRELELLGEIVKLFTPTAFRKFVDVTKDFHYDNCERGASVYDYPFVMWPKFMKVTSRTDLGLDKPAANGTLVYKRGDFLTELEQIFR